MITLALPEDVLKSLQAAVLDGRFVSMDDAVTQALRTFLANEMIDHSSSTPADSNTEAVPAHGTLWERVAELRKNVPDEEWVKLPVDGSLQHDHYIHGTPKRPLK